jgi:hypothetical protein
MVDLTVLHHMGLGDLSMSLRLVGNYTIVDMKVTLEAQNNGGNGGARNPNKSRRNH